MTTTGLPHGLRARPSSVRNPFPFLSLPISPTHTPSCSLLPAPSLLNHRSHNVGALVSASSSSSVDLPPRHSPLLPVCVCVCVFLIPAPQRYPIDQRSTWIHPLAASQLFAYWGSPVTLYLSSYFYFLFLFIIIIRHFVELPSFLGQKRVREPPLACATSPRTTAPTTPNVVLLLVPSPCLSALALPANSSRRLSVSVSRSRGLDHPPVQSIINRAHSLHRIQLCSLSLFSSEENRSKSIAADRYYRPTASRALCEDNYYNHYY